MVRAHLAAAAPATTAVAEALARAPGARTDRSRACSCLRGTRRPRRPRHASSRRRSITSTTRSCSPACARPSNGSWRRSPRRERIAVHGDYDVDGITLDGDPPPLPRDARRRRRALHPGSAEGRLRPAAGDHRAAARRRRPRWSSRSTAGSAAPEAARRARELGLDLIITDHHEPDADAAATRWP